MEPKRMKCESCQLEFWESQLARFGRHKGSPYFCIICAKAEFDRLHNKISHAKEMEALQSGQIVEVKK